MNKTAPLSQQEKYNNALLASIVDGIRKNTRLNNKDKERLIDGTIKVLGTRTVGPNGDKFVGEE